MERFNMICSLHCTSKEQAMREILNMQQPIHQQEPEPHEEEGDSCVYAEMIQPFIPKFEFEGAAAELVGQVGMQPELGIKCTCCGEAEHRKTLICDACENSFHLKCLKLRLSHALLLDRWLCMGCTSSLDEHPLQPSCQHTPAFGDELRKRSSPSKRHRHSEALPHVEDGASKIRFIFKLKSAHFKGARALANEEPQMASDRSTNESIKEVLDSTKRPSCQVECLNWEQQQGHANPSTIPCPEGSEELIVAHGRRKKKTKRVHILVVSEKDKKDADSSKLPSCQMQSLSFDHQHNRAGLDQCKNDCEEFLRAFCIREEKANTADNSASHKHTANGLELVTHHSLGLEFDDEYHKHKGDACTLSEMAKEVEFVEVRENEREIDDKTIDMTEEATPYNTDCPLTSFVGPDTGSSRSGLARTNKKVHEEAEENGIHEEKANTADNSASHKHTANGLESVTHHSTGVEFDDEYHKHKGDVCTLSEMAKEVKFVEVQENEREIDDKTIDVTEEPTPYNTDCPLTSFVGPDAGSSRSGLADTNKKVHEEAEENRSCLVRVLNDAKMQLWHKDAIEFMDLEPSRGSNDNYADNGEALLLSMPHSQLHVKLDTTRILQVYADCRERGIIVYHMCGRMEDHVEASQQTNVKKSDLAIERTWSLGGGFYVLLLGSKEAAKEVIFKGTIPFQGGDGYAIPYVPCFSPNQGPERACPVWVTFLHLPIYFRPFLPELAEWLGKVLYIPCGEALEASDSPRVCICWKISKCIPEFLLVDMEGLGSKKLKVEFDLSLLRRLSESFP